MRADLSYSLPAVFGFLLVLARISGVILFVPIPGLSAVPDAPRIVLLLALSFVLLPAWPTPSADLISLGRLPIAIGAEFSFGLLIGICVAFLLEGFQIAAQMIGLQAGYSFASTVDPTTQADSSVLQVMTQMFTGLLFFALGLDREVIRVLAGSFHRFPSIAQLPNGSVATAVVHLGSQIFIVGLRLALPVVALLILTDLSFAIMGKVHQQFQVMSLTFAAKMLAGLCLMTMALTAFPGIAQIAAAHTIQVLTRLLGG
jgi:flagellar biosynthetic protein FliR